MEAATVKAEAKSLAAHAKLDDDTSVARIAQLTKQLNFLKTEEQRLKDLSVKADTFHADKQSDAKAGGLLRNSTRTGPKFNVLLRASA
jgi:hypothetical protein